MNGSGFKVILTVMGFLLLSVFLIGDILAGGGNQISQAIKWLGVVACIAGFVFPKSGILIFITALYYVDFFKRLLVLGDNVSMQDLMISLGAGPAMVISICIYCTMSAVVGRIEFNKKIDYIFYISCTVISLFGWFMSGSDDIIDRGQSVINSSMLGMTSLACYCLYRSKNEVTQLLNTLVFAGIPMAIYTIWQAIFGFTRWEEMYIETGMSKILYNFYIVGGGIDGMRPFSTLNLHPSVGAVSAMMFVISLFILPEFAKSEDGRSKYKYVYIIAAILYLLSCLLCQNRTTYFLPIFYLIFAWSFRTYKRLILVYGGGSLAVLLVVLNSEYLNDQVLVWSDDLLNSALGQSFGTLGTMQARLHSFTNLLDPNMWTPFGIPLEDLPPNHDMMTNFLTRFGYVSLSLTLIAMYGFIVWWHRRILAINEGAVRNYLIKMSAVIVALFVCGLAYGNLIFVSPVNAFVGVLIATAFVFVRDRV